MINICVPLPRRGRWQNQWDYALSNFNVDNIYVLGTTLPPNNVFRDAILIDNAESLPTDTLVVLASTSGRYVQGDEDLTTFVHPTDVTYMYGGDDINLNGDELGTRVPDHKVYIPNDTTDEMYSWVAFGVTMWDRRSKGG